MQTHPIAELRRLASAFRHVRAEHKDEGPSGSWRRRQETQLTDMEERFQTLLDHWIRDDRDKEQWRAYFYRGTPEPDEAVPEAAFDEPPVFKGRSGGGAEVIIREASDGQFEVIVNGNVIDRYAARWSLGAEKLAPLSVGGFLFEEVFDAAEPARAAFLQFVAEPGREPPWEWAWELLRDGLIDPSFALTARGRRLVAITAG